MALLNTMAFMCSDGDVCLNEKSMESIKDDDDAPCDVCRSKIPEDGNEMVYCSSCNVCVHQACYGIATVPQDDWYCAPCCLNIQPRCALCPKKGGAMKSSSDGEEWAHVSCAWWIKEVSIGIPEKMEPINIPKIPTSTRRWNLICSLCCMRYGVCIQCMEPQCNAAYHVTCAFDKGLRMDMCVDTSKDGIKLLSFCKEHTENQQHKSKHKTRKKDDLEVKDDTIFAQFLPGIPSTSHDSAPSTSHDSAPSTSHDSAPSTSHDSAIVDNSNPMESIVENRNGVPPVADATAPSEEVLTRNFIDTTLVSIGTARKSFSGPPTKIKKVQLSHILLKENAKKGAGKKSLPPPWKPRRLEDSSSKKSQTQQSSSKAKHSTDEISGSELQPSAARNEPGNTPSEGEQPSLYLTQLLKSAQNSESSEDSSIQTPPKQHRSSTVPNKHLPRSSKKEHQVQKNHHRSRSSSSPEIEHRLLAVERRYHMSSLPISHPPSSEMGNQPLAAETPHHMSSTPNNHRPSEMEHQSFAAASRSHMSSVLKNHPPFTELGRHASNKLDNFAEFSAYLASLLRTLPFKKALEVQKKVLSLVLKEHYLSSSDEYDVSSISSD